MPNDDKKATRARINALLAVYGSLLTDKQREYTIKRYKDGLAFSRIAAAAGVSRQSIYDTVRQAVAAMEHYEHHLGLLAQGTHVSEAHSITGENNITANNIIEIRDALALIQRRICRERVLYNTDWLLRELNRLLALLEQKK